MAAESLETGTLRELAERWIADDPDPVRKQQAKALVGDISKTAQRLLEENNFLRRNHDMFSKLTKQEKEVLKYLALGCSSTEIASKLFISEATANTHRRNVKSKLNAKSNYDLSMFARAFDLI